MSLGLRLSAPDGAYRRTSRTLSRWLSGIGSRPVTVACLLAVITGIAVQSWFRSDTVIASGDNLPAGFLNPDRILDAGRWLWGTSITATGGPDFYAITQTIPAFLGKLMSVFGSAPDVTQRVFLTLAFAALPAAMFLLLHTVLPSPRRLAGAITGSVFYAFSPALLFIAPNTVYLVALILLPLLPALVLRGSRTSGWRYPAMFALASALLSYAFANPPMALLVLAACASALLVSVRARPRETISFALRSTLLAVPLNLWWLVPATMTLLGAGRGGVIPGGDVLSWSWTDRRSSFLNVLALTPGWSWPDPMYFPFGPTLEQPAFVGARLFLSLSALAVPALVPRSVRPKALMITLGALVMVVLAKGVHPPLGTVNALLYRYVPGMWLFREPASKFTLVLSYLLVVALALLVSGIQRPGLRRALAGVFMATTLAVSYPLWTGEVIPGPRPPLPGARVQVPDWWQEAAGFLNTRPGRTLLLPPDDYYQMPYTWGFYGADVFARELIDPPVVVLLPVAGNAYLAPDRSAENLMEELRQAVSARAWPDVARLARILGIRWILVRGDIDSSFPGRDIQDPAALARGLEGAQAFRWVRDFGPLKLLELTEPAPGSVWSATEAFVTSAQDVPSLLTLPLHEGTVLLAKRTVDELTAPTLIDISPGTWDLGTQGVVAQISVPPGPNRAFVRWPDGLPVEAAKAADSDGWRLLLVPPDLVMGDSSLSLRPWTVDIPSVASVPRYVVLDRQVVPVSSQPRSGTEPVTLASGPSRLSVFSGPADSSLADPSFEEGTWGQVGDCNAYDDRSPEEVGLRAERVKGGTDGRFALALSALDHTACISQRAAGFDPRAVYRISLDYLRREGAAPRLCVWQEGPERCADLPPLEPGEGWRHYEQAFRPAPGTQGLRVFLYAAGSPGGTTILYDDVRLQRYKTSTSVTVTVPGGWMPLGSLSGTGYPTNVAVPYSAPLKPVLADPSFEKGTWGRVGDCNRFDDRSPAEVGLRAERVEGGTDGRFALALSALDHTACVSQRVEGFDPQAVYQISLDYLRREGAAPRLCVWQEGPERCADLPPLEPGEGWRHYEQAFRPAPGTQGLRVFLYADGSPGGTTILYDDVRLQRVGPAPQVALIPSERNPVAPPPDILSTPVNPTEYRVSVRDVSGRFVLVLNETFDPGWRLVGDVSAIHVRANGYANGWVIDARGDLELSLIYQPQRWVSLARRVSAGGLAVTLIVLVVSTVRRPGRRRIRSKRKTGPAAQGEGFEIE